MWEIRWEAALLTAFGLLALLIAAVGLYGVIAFVTRRRTREIGIRLALGAQKHEVLRIVAYDTLTLTLAGIVLGLVISLAVTDLLRRFLYGLSPADPTTFAAAALLRIAVSLMAGCVPAWRATTINPSVALREE